MLQEILLALCGFTGDVFKEQEDENDSGSGQLVNEFINFEKNSQKTECWINSFGRRYTLNRDLHFLVSEGERALLNEIVSIGYDYSVVRKFVDKIRHTTHRGFTYCMLQDANPNFFFESSSSFSVHLTAVDHDPTATGGTFGRNISSKIAPCTNYFNTNKNNEPCGLYILGVVECINEILDSYLRQICLIESILMNDPSLPITIILTKLFTHRTQLKALKGLVAASLSFTNVEVMISSYNNKLLDYILRGCSTGNPTIRELHRKLLFGYSRVFLQQCLSWMLYGQLIDPFFEFCVRRWSLSEDNNSVTTNKMSTIGDSFEDLTKELTPQGLQFEWSYLFHLSAEATPIFVCSKTAIKLLFVGKAVRVLTRSGRWKNEDIKEAQCIFDQAFKNLGKVNISQLIDQSVESLRVKTAQLLWKLVVYDVNLLLHFKALRDFYLLGNGIFYRDFIELSWEMMRQIPGKRAEYHLQSNAWASAVQVIEESGCPYRSSVLRNRNEIFLNGETEVTNEVDLIRMFTPKLTPEYFEFTKFPSISEAQGILTCSGSAKLDNSVLLLGIYENDFHHNREISKSEISNKTYGTCWLNQKQNIAYGFMNSFVFSTNFSISPVGYKLKRPLVSGSRFAMVFQNRRTPMNFKIKADYTKGFWPNLGDCFVIEFKLSLAPTNEDDCSDRKINGKKNDEVSFQFILEVSIFIGSGSICALLGISSKNNDGDEMLRDLYSSNFEFKNTMNSEYSEKNFEENMKIHSPKKEFCDSTEINLSKKLFENSLDSRNPNVVLVKTGKRKWVVNTPIDEVISEKMFLVKIIYCQKDMEVYVDSINGENSKNSSLDISKSQPLIKAKALDLSQCLDLDLGTAFLGFMTVPHQYHHKILSSCGNVNRNELVFSSQPIFTSHDRCAVIYKWSHSSFQAPLSLPCYSVINSFNCTSRKNSNLTYGIISDYVDASFWKKLRLAYIAQWPIPLIVSTSNIDSYNAIFQFLFLVKRAHYNLKRAWVDAACVRKTRIHDSVIIENGWNSIWISRSRMDYFLLQLLCYFQETIIEVEFDYLCSQVTESRDFERVKAAHDHFLENLISKCFLGLQSVYRPILNAVNVIIAFGYTILDYLAMHAQLDGSDLFFDEWIVFSNKIHFLRTAFNKHMAEVFVEIFSLHQNIHQKQLAQLVLRLNFNDFMSEVVRSVMNSVSTKFSMEDKLDVNIKSGFSSTFPLSREASL